MGASLLVFSNKTDIEDCMTDQEIHEVRNLLSLGQVWRTELNSDFSWIVSRHIDGPSSNVVQSQARIFKKACNGSSKMPKTGSSFIDLAEISWRQSDTGVERLIGQIDEVHPAQGGACLQL